MTSLNKTALVTGASSGIGYATAVELAKRGYTVFAGARRLEPMKPLADEYGIITLQLDVTSQQLVEQAKALICLHLDVDRGLDLLFNNAGQSYEAPALDLDDTYIQQCYDVNVLGPMRLVREFGPLVINAKGTIAFMGSVAALIPTPFLSVYASTKAALHQYASTLHLEMKAFDVKVMLVEAGGVSTGMLDPREPPAHSIYDIPEMKASIEVRKNMLKDMNAMTPALFASQIVSDFENSSKFAVYRGTLSRVVYWTSILVPKWLQEWVFLRKFKLVGAFKILRKKYSQVKLAA